jgi:hypothetical protein
MNLFTVATGQRVRIRTNAVRVIAPDGAQMCVCRPTVVYAVATGRYRRDESGALRRQFILVGRPFIPNMRALWVGDATPFHSGGRFD